MPTNHKAVTMEMLNYKQVAENIRKELSTYIQQYGLKSLVVGESGGIDSALCTALAAPVCRELGVALIGRSITIETNKQDEIDRGAAIGEAFCTDFKAIDLTAQYLPLRTACEFEQPLGTDISTKLRMGNIKARMRMVYLYDLAQKHGGLVLSTDNFTEYLLGFWTLHGDVGDYGMIQTLWKTEVYGLSQYLVDLELSNERERLALQRCIDAVPTDGLGITNSDLDQLGAATYTEVDQLLMAYLENPTQLDRSNPVIQRHIRSGYKRSNPMNLGREVLVKGAKVAASS